MMRGMGPGAGCSENFGMPHPWKCWGLEEPALVKGVLWQWDWKEMTFRIPSIPNNSVIP